MSARRLLGIALALVALAGCSTPSQSENVIETAGTTDVEVEVLPTGTPLPTTAPVDDTPTVVPTPTPITLSGGDGIRIAAEDEIPGDGEDESADASADDGDGAAEPDPTTTPVPSATPTPSGDASVEPTATPVPTPSPVPTPADDRPTLDNDPITGEPLDDPADPTPTPAPDPAEVRIANGAEVYTLNCARCHSENGTGTFQASGLIGVSSRYTSASMITELTSGHPVTFGFADKLSAGEIRDVVAYVLATFG